MNQIPQEGQVPNAWVRTLEELAQEHPTGSPFGL
jgi:hypothetical protein